MNVHTIGATSRPRLFLNFEARGNPRKAAHERRAATLSSLELRRLVAAMVD